MRIQQRRRIRRSGAAVKPAAVKPNERWSMDFVSDCVSTGRVIRLLAVVDDCTPECPGTEVDTSLGGQRVRRVLDRIATERGLPQAIVVDNGPEFRGRALAAWSEERLRAAGVHSARQARGLKPEAFMRRHCVEMFLIVLVITTGSIAAQSVSPWFKVGDTTILSGHPKTGH